jgi:hypothetical protein
MPIAHPRLPYPFANGRCFFMAIGTVNRVGSSRDRRLGRGAKVSLRTPDAGDRHARIGFDDAIEPSNESGLFRVRFGRPHTSLATRQRRRASLPERPAPARVPLSRTRVGKALRRYCSGCARETEHVIWPRREPASIPSIRWPVAEPAANSTMCQDCGQLRVAACRLPPPAWSDWPREPQAANEGVQRAMWQDGPKYVEHQRRTRSNLDPGRRHGTRRERQWQSMRTSPSGTARI